LLGVKPISKYCPFPSCTGPDGLGRSMENFGQEGWYTSRGTRDYKAEVRLSERQLARCETYFKVVPLPFMHWSRWTGTKHG
jgi:hypothetical protein